MGATGVRRLGRFLSGRSPGRGSAERTRMLLTDALNVLAELPCQAEPLPVFAARVLNRHAHDLGDDTPLATLVLRALATLYGTVPPQSAAERCALWSRAGVADDELSATVVVGGLRLVSDGLLARVARLCTEAGQAASPSPTSGTRVSSPCPPPSPHSLSTWWRTPASWPSPFAASAPTVRRLSARLAGPALPRSSSCAYSSTGMPLFATTVTSMARTSALPHTSWTRRGRTPGA